MLTKWKHTDWTLITVLLCMMGICIPVVHSAVANSDKFRGLDMQMIFYYILGFVVVFLMTLVDYRLYVKYFWLIYGGGMLLLLLTLTPLGQTQNGAQGWLKLGPIGMQPAELFKLALVIAIASLLARRNKEKLGFFADVIPIGLVAFVPFAVVMLQNDLGNALSYVLILLGLLWIGNLKFLHAIMIFVLGAGLLFGGIKAYVTYHDEVSHFMTDTLHRGHWLDRIDPWLMPDEASRDASWQTKNGKYAIAGGGMIGQGYKQGEMVQNPTGSLVPYTYSDSIIVVIGEEFGFVGISLLLVLYFVLIHRMIVIALECRERAGSYTIVGIVAMFMYQIFENIGMFIGLMPLTGITLPFISYGGTSLLINMASIGVVMSIRACTRDMAAREEFSELDKGEKNDGGLQALRGAASRLMSGRTRKAD
ncbi:FtsW/RodA/SpoVE family cell cycle protein [Saccharibacillus sp. CPCC 101409]|uniref:FtsW/RodA/SpoVE family cell cycle protein n=1 Tax=Saccharibacillus sp. CPCC 101409 TaxID=3058041 RepID=UPI0026734232|nr:FtsW/RodA/SpoVE family cell cycle protein [Saccharibacillus sp. CPCC 101409]MDO3412131.1 FtsW/RodA/SpoVE family cell cycle protein [Saccharibacillus sp. CPCC 101409]